MEVSLPGDCNESPVGPAELLNADSVASSNCTAVSLEASWCGAGLQYTINSEKNAAKNVLYSFALMKSFLMHKPKGLVCIKKAYSVLSNFFSSVGSGTAKTKYKITNPQIRFCD